MKTFKIGGIHPPHNKITAGCHITDAPLPAEVTLMLSQHIGAPATPIVAKGEHVERGQMVAKASGFISAPVHSPVSGTVVKITTVTNHKGFPVEAIVIKTDAEQGEMQLLEGAGEGEHTPGEIRDLIARAGIVGLGGATFPTPVKLAPPAEFKPELVIVNGAECEPYLTNDHALMLEHPDDIIAGTRLLMKATGVKRAVIAIENNKRDAIELITSKSGNGISVVPLKVKYPQGGEKQLIDAVTGRRVADGALPVSTGCIVQNVATAYAISRAVIHGEPLTYRIVTVTGDGLSTPSNYRVALGTPVSEVIALGTPDPEHPAEKVIFGGPMMGQAAMTIDTFTSKGTSGLLLLGPDAAHRSKPEPCIRCAACVAACPMGLEPYLLATLSRLGRLEDAEKNDVTACIECGSCSYSCPASRPILDYIRVGKSSVMAARRSRQQ